MEDKSTSEETFAVKGQTELCFQGHGEKCFISKAFEKQKLPMLNTGNKAMKWEADIINTNVSPQESGC